ncbi:MAG: oligosaccharide flippase family protein [Christensenellaceae bacterium]
MSRNLLRILSANILYLLLSIINSFLLPQILSMETYAMIKTYTLYIGYAGFFSLGYADGMYLKYGGVSFDKIDQKDLSSSFKSFALFEMLICAVCLFLAVILRNFIFASFAIGVFCINLIGYYKNLYQAVGEYTLYGKSLNYQTILMLAANLLLLFVVRSDDYHAYVAVQVISALLVMAFLTVMLERKKHLFHQGKASLMQVNENVRSGFVLMIGNFSSSIFTSLDRWFVKILLTSTHFALYSFAVSLENLINVFITPITISLYNLFCKNRERDYIYRIKQLTLLWGFLVIAASFPVDFILKYFLTKYYDVRTIVYLLFAAQAFYAVIKGISVNLYKAEHKQRRYFIIMTIMTVTALALNILFYAVFRTMESLALATFVTASIWMAICEIERPDIRFSWKEYLFIGLQLASYFIGSAMANVLVGLGIYLAAYLVFSLILMQSSVKYLLNQLKNKNNN